ncbi:MAG: DUF4834 family protein [Bacteroidaceae bacterium]|nr:DUF4834 family protein [Bacteroidaceae bacterium]
MFHLLGSIILFIFSFIVYFLLGVFVLGVILFAVMGRKLRGFGKENTDGDGKKKGDSSTRNASSGSKDPGPIATDFEQPIYDDENAEYVDYEEVK